MNSLQQSIEQQGWGNISFELSEADRAQFARSANALIYLAQDDQKIWDALGHDIHEGEGDKIVRTGTFGVGRARNSADDKIYIHTGFESKNRTDAVMPLRNQPQEMREFWDLNTAMLDAARHSMQEGLSQLGATSVYDTMFPDTPRNIHLRTLRYPGAIDEPVGKEVGSGHADLGLATLHLFETHGGWFKGAPYKPELISAADSPERRESIRDMRRQLMPIESDIGKAVFFLGANWHTFPYTPENLRDLPACYHAGFKPEANEEVVSEYAESVTHGNPDRVSVIVFGHPAARYFANNLYTPANVPMCRPEYE